MEKQTRNGLGVFILLALIFSGFVLAKTTIGPKGVDTGEWLNATSGIKIGTTEMIESQWSSIIQASTYPEQFGSFVIWQSGGNYYVKSGSTGLVNTSTNAYTLYNYAYTNLPAAGGLIFFKTGDYDFGSNQMIIAEKGISILGETIYDGKQTFGVNIEYSGDDYAVEIGDNSEYFYQVKLSNLNFYLSNDTAAGGVKLYAVVESWIENVRVTTNSTNNNARAFHLIASNTRACMLNKLINTQAHSTKYGWVLSKEGAARCNGNIFQFGEGYGLAIAGGIGIYMNGTNVGDTNQFEKISTSNYVTHVKMDATSYANVFTGIRMEDGTTAVNITGNRNAFRDCSFGALAVINTGNYNNFENCYTYDSEWYGAATVKSGEWVTHNVDGNPAVVMLTPRMVRYDNVPLVVSLNNKNATKFQVLIYWVNGTEILDDVVTIYYHAYLYGP